MENNSPQKHLNYEHSGNSATVPACLFINQKEAESYQCNICYQVPFPEYAYYTNIYAAIFCEECRNKCLAISSSCPICKDRSFQSNSSLIQSNSKKLYSLMLDLVACNGRNQRMRNAPEREVWQFKGSHNNRMCLCCYSSFQCGIRIKRW